MGSSLEMSEMSTNWYDWYDIIWFPWVKAENSFIVPLARPGLHPIGKRQFYIKNNNTQNFRRFRYVEEQLGYNVFQSEDGIKCKIKTDWLCLD